jgi:hypothetical protein
MEKIDHRKHYVLVLDTETANTMRDDSGQLDTSSTLMYDCGWSVMAVPHGEIYEERSFINSDIFVREREMMQSAYYAKKIPQYEADLASGKRKMATTYEIRSAMLADMEKYGIKEVIAHNARFDYNSLNTTQRWETKSAFRYWFPYGVTIWDSARMARSVILKMPTYRKFCEKHDLLTKTGRLPFSAETLYKFITKNPDFVESHTGLEDVQIEREIVLYCYRQHKPMKKLLFDNQRTTERPTDTQKKIMEIVKNNA